MNMSYTSIGCTFHECLESWSQEQQPCKIQYRRQDGSAVEVASKIVDLFTWQGAEYMLMEKGQLIRLDRLLSVNETTPPLFL